MRRSPAPLAEGQNASAETAPTALAGPQAQRERQQPGCAARAATLTRRQHATLRLPAARRLFSLDNVAEVPAASLTGWLNSHRKNNHIGPRSRRRFYLAIDSDHPQARPCLQRRAAKEARDTSAYRPSGTKTAPGVSTPVPSISLKTMCRQLLAPKGSKSLYLAVTPMSLIRTRALSFP
jgi:hypothetical protein